MVLGPYTREDWNFMLYLRKVIVYYKSKDRLKYAIALEKDTKILNKYLTKVAA